MKAPLEWLKEFVPKLYRVFKAWMLIVVVGCAACATFVAESPNASAAYKRGWGERDIALSDIEFWTETLPHGILLYARYLGVPRDKVPSWGHPLYWEAPDGLDGLYMRIDLEKTGCYGKGSFDRDEIAAARKPVYHPGDVPSACYQLCTVATDGAIVFPPGTRYRYVPPSPFDIGSNSLVLTFPVIPKQVDAGFCH